jgi:hypothetical protein
MWGSSSIAAFRFALPYFNRTRLDFTDGYLSESTPAFEHYVDRSDATAPLTVFDAMFPHRSAGIPVYRAPSKHCIR